MMAGPQRGTDYASSDPGGDSNCCRKRLCLKKCSKCSPNLFYVGVWCCVCVLRACMAAHIHSFPLTLRDQPQD